MLFAVLDVADFVIIACIVVFFVGSGVVLRPTDQARLRRLERKLDLLLQHSGIEIPDPASLAGLSAEVKRLADDPKKKIYAIKLHREQTGLSLKEAKDAVEAYMNR